MFLVRVFQVATLVLLSAGLVVDAADDRANYSLRAATEDIELFVFLDRNGDRQLTKEEAKGDLHVGPRFDDIDINRDGGVTRQEMERYVEARYGIQASLLNVR